MPPALLAVRVVSFLRTPEEDIVHQLVIERDGEGALLLEVQDGRPRDLIRIRAIRAIGHETKRDRFTR
jgi:hypothetical protein